MTTPLNLHESPAAGFDEPFELLAACHGRVQRMLDLLGRLGVHLASRGCDGPARQAAQDVMRYFDLAGPAHHEDEERHVFPPLLRDGDALLVATVRQLQRDHVAMGLQWSSVRADLQAVVSGQWQWSGAAPAHWGAFAGLYAGHIRIEEDRVYPAARGRLDAAQQADMGGEMAQRRGAGRNGPAVPRA